jgi:hypothetical protein
VLRERAGTAMGMSITFRYRNPSFARFSRASSGRGGMSFPEGEPVADVSGVMFGIGYPW